MIFSDMSGVNINNIFNKESYPLVGKVVLYTEDHMPYMICDAEIPYILFSNSFGCFKITENPISTILNSSTEEFEKSSMIKLEIKTSDIHSQFRFSFEVSNPYLINDKPYYIRSRGKCRLDPTLSFSLDSDTEPTKAHIMNGSTIELLDFLNKN